MKIFIFPGLTNLSSLNNYVLHLQPGKSSGVAQDNVEKRLRQHNAGRGNFTSKVCPWVLIVSIECSNRSEAVILELRIKKRGIKRYLQDNNLA